MVIFHNLDNEKEKNLHGQLFPLLDVTQAPETRKGEYVL